MCQPSLKISRKSIWKFLHKVANRQTNNDDYISSLVEVIIAGGADCRGGLVVFVVRALVETAKCQNI